MFVLIDRHFEVSLHEVSDLKRFKLVCSSPIPTQTNVTQALARINSQLDAGYAWICVSWLRCHTSVARDLGWQRAFTDLLAYAQKQGWTDIDQKLLRAHVEWQHEDGVSQ